MMKRPSNSMYLLLLILVVGCVGVKPTRNNMNSIPGSPLGYFHEPAVQIENKLPIQIRVVDETEVPLYTEVEANDKRFVWYLIGYNYKYDLSTQLGKLSYWPSLPDFIKNSVEEDLTRFGYYEVSETGPELIIKIDSQAVNTRIVDSGNALGGYQEFRMNGFPSEGRIFLTATFTEEGKIIHEKYYSINRRQDFPIREFSSKPQFYKAVRDNQVELLSELVKDFSKKLIDDLNQKRNMIDD